MTNPEREGRPETTDDRGSAGKSTGGGDGEPEVRRRRVVLHQGLPDPVEPEGGARFMRGAKLGGTAAFARDAKLGETAAFMRGAKRGETAAFMRGAKLGGTAGFARGDEMAGWAGPERGVGRVDGAEMVGGDGLGRGVGPVDAAGTAGWGGAERSAGADIVSRGWFVRGATVVGRGRRLGRLAMGRVWLRVAESVGVSGPPWAVAVPVLALVSGSATGSKPGAGCCWAGC